MLIYANIQTSGDSLSYLLLLNTLNQNIKVANLRCIMLWQSIYMHKRTVLPCVAVGEVVCRGVVVVWRVHVVLCFIAFCAVSCFTLFSVILFAHYPNNGYIPNSKIKPFCHESQSSFFRAERIMVNPVRFSRCRRV